MSSWVVSWVMINFSFFLVGKIIIVEMLIGYSCRVTIVVFHQFNHSPMIITL